MYNSRVNVTFHRLLSNLPFLVGVLGILFIVGVLIAATTTNNSQWLHWSYSALGEGRTLSSSVFNGMLLMAAVLVWRIGDRLAYLLVKLHNQEASRLSHVALRGLAVCIIGIAVLPNDIYHSEHLIFARALIVIFTLYTLILPMTLTELRRRERLLSYTMPTLAILLSIRGYAERAVPFVLFETIFAFCAFVWFFMFCTLIQRRDDRSTCR